ncbi:MAG: Xaa-Pro peptidase family protein [Streptococcaceae bacterium]|nr:Xaa-Pro peptidase family protein [Streptococcaceae bacterium]
MTKIQHIQHFMQQEAIDLTYINNPTTINYLTGFLSNPNERVLALIIPSNQSACLLVSELEAKTAQAKSQLEVIGYLDSENPFEKLKERMGNAFRTVACDFNSLTVDKFKALEAIFQPKSFQNITPLIDRMQLIKTQDEIDKLLKAGEYADLAFHVGFKAAKVGVSEQEIVIAIEDELKKHGIRKMSFDTLVLSGDNAANPHGEPGERQVRNNELLLFDLGVLLNGYNSDATRTIAIGEVDNKKREVYDIVRQAQLAAQSQARVGMSAQELDGIAREVITRAGYGEYFNHRLGHGIGQTVHEFPSIVAGNDLILEEGMCFSIEPGIYIPKEVGVRIEDCVYLTADGAKPFTKTTKELLIF